MSKAENTKKKIEQISLQSTPKMRNRILSDATKAMEQTINASAKTSSAKRIIMQSKITRYAAAAVIILAGMIIVNQFGGSVDIVSKAYGISDVPELYSSANTIHVKRYIANVKFLNEQETTLYSEDWIDIENGRFRTSGLGMATIRGSKKRTGAVGLEFILNGNFRIQINHSFKVAQFYKLSDFKRKLSIREQVDRFLETIFLSDDELTGYVKVGQEQIDDKNYDIWEKDFVDTEQKPERITKYWLSPSDGELKKVQHWRRYEESDGEWSLTSEEQIERNVVPPEGIFEIVAPEGYRLSNTKETAFISRFIACPIRDNSNSAIAVIIALPDGIVIMGWNEKNISPESSTAKSIRNLEAGGILPEMPIEINLTSGSPTYTDLKITHIARHLAYTQKEDKFYEWTIYVPMEDISSTTLSKDTILNIRLSPEIREHPEIAEMNSFLKNRSLLTIKPHEFEEFVLGAMAELSDDGKVPAGITYDGVLELAKQIRASIE